MQSTASPLAKFMAEHKITGDVRYIGRETDSENWDHYEFRFRLEIAGAWLLDNARYFAGTGHDPAGVTLEDAFGAVVSDAVSVDGRDSWVDWADNLGLVDDARSAERAMRDFAEIKARASLLLEALGDDAYAELLEIASQL